LIRKIKDKFIDKTKMRLKEWMNNIG